MNWITKLVYKLENFIPVKILSVAFAVFVVAVFGFFHIGFKPELQDNAWSLYWAYDLVNNGIVEDRFIGIGLANLSVTGMTPAFFYGVILNVIGWTLPMALLISTLLVCGGLGIWIKFLKERDWSNFSLFLFFILGILLDAYFEPAHTTKSDAFTFFMLSLAFYTFTREKYLLAGLLGVITVECHPIGVTVFLYMLGYFLGNRKRILEKSKIKPFVLFGFGIAAGIAYYFLLHYNALFQSDYSLQGTLENNEQMFYFSSYILKYFLPGGISKHWPEFLILAAALVIAVKQKLYREVPDFFWIFGILLITSWLNPRPVHTYVIMVFPVMMMILVYTAERIKLRNCLMLFFFLLLVPQFGYLALKSMSWPPHVGYIANIRENLPSDDSLPVVGSNNEWFACIGTREYHHYSRLDLIKSFKPDEFYLILENDGRKDGLPDKWLDQYDAELVNSFDNYGEVFQILHMRKI